MLRWRDFTLPSLFLKESMGEPTELAVGVKLVGVDMVREVGDLRLEDVEEGEVVVEPG
jgi:hypothetical protein